MKIMDYIDRLEELAQTATRVPLTGKAIVDPDDLFDLAEEMRENLPTEIREAARLVQQRNEILAQAQKQAQQIVEEAKAQADRLIAEHEILREAEQKMNTMLQEAYAQRKEIIRTGLERVEELLRNLEPLFEQAAVAALQLQDHVAKVQTGLEQGHAQIEQWRHQVTDSTIKHA